MSTTMVYLSDLDLGLASSAMRARPDLNVLGEPIRMKGVTAEPA